jgi:hypothetical protein
MLAGSRCFPLYPPEADVARPVWNVGAITGLHSITSSARSKSDDGTSTEFLRGGGIEHGLEARRLLDRQALRPSG